MRRTQIPHRIVPSPKRSELQLFAMWFHQDWKLLFPDFYTGARMYLRNLSPERRDVLGKQLKQFLEANAAASTSAQMKKSWLQLGAQGWQASLDIHATLRDFLTIIQGESPRP